LIDATADPQSSSTREIATCGLRSNPSVVVRLDRALDEREKCGGVTVNRPFAEPVFGSGRVTICVVIVAIGSRYTTSRGGHRMDATTPGNFSVARSVELLSCR
jgi:hypothetical protein